VKKKILLTRPHAASEYWASLLARHGFESILDPLLTIAPTHAPRPRGFFQACVITSANALNAAGQIKASMGDLLSLPCFCVGAATGKRAREFGFSDIHCGVSDSAELTAMIAATLADKSRPLLHIAGEAVDAKAHDLLAEQGFSLTPWAVYRAHAAHDFTAQTQAAFAAGEIAAIPLFSPRSAGILVSIIEKNRLVHACSGIVAVGLSQAVADVLELLPWRRLHVAAAPSEEEVLACLQKEFS
jgi:uroporphyrinogen-III synthase